MRTFLLLFVSLFSLLAQASVYQDWGAEWTYANEPTEGQLKGTWAGRCVTDSDRDYKRAAIYVFKYVEDASTIPPERPSQSYFYSNTRPENFFDKLTGKQAVEVKEVAAWFKQDAWERARPVGGSMTNSHGGFRRLARVVNDEFSSVILVRIEREGSPDAQTLCRFAKKLVPTASTDPGNAQMLMNVVTLPGGRYHTPSLAPNFGFQKIQIISDGPRAVTVREFTGMLATGQLWSVTQPFTLHPGVPVIVETSNGKNVQVSDFIFTTSGFTRGLRIFGYAAPEAR